MVAAPSRARPFTPARVVALVLIALAGLGLAYLHFADDRAVSVPLGAKAGDLTLESCSYGAEGGRHAADCGTLVVPENRADPRSRLIALPVTRIHARADHPAEPIFRLEGGPGKTNMEFPYASRFADDHDVILLGYRGVDGSVRLDCPEVASALKHSTDLLGEESFRAYADGFRSCADRLTEDGVDLAGYSLTQRVDDLEAARAALGYDRIDLVSESAGTRYAMVYAWRYPKRVHRSAMIAVNPPGNFVWDAKTTDVQLRRYAALCAEDESHRPREAGAWGSRRREGRARGAPLGRLTAAEVARSRALRASGPQDSAFPATAPRDVEPALAGLPYTSRVVPVAAGRRTLLAGGTCAVSTEAGDRSTPKPGDMLMCRGLYGSDDSEPATSGVGRVFPIGRSPFESERSSSRRPPVGSAFPVFRARHGTAPGAVGSHDEDVRLAGRTRRSVDDPLAVRREG